METQKTRHSLLYGTALLFASNVLVKGLGFFYRVALVRLMGAEGIGLVEMVTPIYSFLLVLAGLGLQPALAQNVAGKSREEAELSFRASRRVLRLSGMAVTLAALALSPLLARYFAADQRIALALRAILPAVYIISLASAWRGWFHGRRDLGVLGMSQNAEQVARVLVGLYLVQALRPYGLEQASAGVSLATVAGELVGFLYLIAVRRLRRKKEGAPIIPSQPGYGQAARRLLGYGLPMTGGRLVNSALLMMQAFLIPYCLQISGHSVSAATEIYGRLSGVALTLLHLPGVFASALSTAVMPAVAESRRQPDSLRSYILRPLQATMTCTLPALALLFIYARPLCAGLFDNAPASPLLMLLAPGGVFFYLQMTLAGVLQGLGDVKRLLVNNIIAGCAMVIGIMLLTPLPQLGVYGAAAAMDISWLCGFLLHLAAVRRHLTRRLPWGRILGLPLLALSGAVCAWLFTHAQGLPAAASIASSGAVYGLVLLAGRKRQG